MWYFTEQNGPNWGPHKNEFQIQKSGKRKQVDEKIGVIPVVSLPELCSLNYQKNFWQFCAELSKKSKSIKAIYIYTSESSRNALSENCIVYYILRLNVSEILGFEIEEFC